jgi:hypothetical protein
VLLNLLVNAGDAKEEWMSAKWLWLVLGLTACVDPDAPNGKQGILFFRLESADPVAVGLEEHLTLLGETPRSTFNFTDTTLEVEASPGVSVVEKRQVTLFEGGLSYQLSYRCESAGSRELRVRVLDRNKGARYSDAFDVACATPANLGQDYVGANDAGPLPGGHFLVGARIQITLKVTDRNERALAGRGLVELVDEQGVTRPMPGGIPHPGRSLYLEALKPGEGLRVRLAGLEAPLPVHVVEDTAITLELGVQHRPGSGWSAIADARHIPTAYRVGGLEPCTWDVRFASGTVLEEQGKCYRTVPDTLGAGTVCVSSHGHRTCADFPSR